MAPSILTGLPFNSFQFVVGGLNQLRVTSPVLSSSLHGRMHQGRPLVSPLFAFDTLEIVAVSPFTGELSGDESTSEIFKDLNPHSVWLREWAAPISSRTRYFVRPQIQYRVYTMRRYLANRLLDLLHIGFHRIVQRRFDSLCDPPYFLYAS